MNNDVPDTADDTETSFLLGLRQWKCGSEAKQIQPEFLFELSLSFLPNN